MGHVAVYIFHGKCFRGVNGYNHCVGADRRACHKLHFGFEAYHQRIWLRLLCASDLRGAVLACRPFPERMGPELQSLIIVKVKNHSSNSYRVISSSFTSFPMYTPNDIIRRPHPTNTKTTLIV